MLSQFTSRFTRIFEDLKRKAVLREADVTDALRNIRRALLEADVALPVVKDFLQHVKNHAVGQEVLGSVTPGQQIIKIVHDQIVNILGSTTSPLNVKVSSPPMVMVVFGLQGSGKTTTCAKLALHLKEKERFKVLLMSVDTSRPAAQNQLQILGEHIQVKTLSLQDQESPEQIAQRGLYTAKVEGYDVVLCDTAGRNTLNAYLLEEAKKLQSILSPVETLLVVDSMIGQDSVTIAKTFDEFLNITGVIATRVDGDARGGGLLSMRFVTGKPIKLIGFGERVQDLETISS